MLYNISIILLYYIIDIYHIYIVYDSLLYEYNIFIYCVCSRYDPDPFRPLRLN